MAIVLQRYEVGEDVRPPVMLDRRRRRLSTIAKRHRIPGRPYIVSVHRKNSAYSATDDSVVLRRKWKDTLVGPEDVVLITYLPLGGGRSGSSGGGGKQIGMAIAMLVVAIAAPYLVGAIGAASTGLGAILGTTGALSLAGKIVAMGIIAGVGYLISKATKPKANKSDDNRPVYGISGGGNLPRKGDRIPVNYGKTWTTPDLSQPDYFQYESTADDIAGDQVLYKRVTLGGGKYHVHTIRVGDAVMWDETNGYHAPFQNAQVEFITPGQNSVLVPGAVWSSDQVQGIDLGYADDPNPWHGPYPVTQPGVQTSRIQLDYSWPQGFWQSSAKKTQKMAIEYGVTFWYQEIDDDGNPIGPLLELWSDIGTGLSSRAVRRTKIVDVPMGRYQVQAQNHDIRLYDYLENAGVQEANQVYWDGLRAHLFTEPVRPQVQEIAFKISAKAVGSTMSFSDIWVEATKIVPVYTGGGWVDQPTRKAIWAYADILRNADYGGAIDNTKIDIATLQYYDANIPAGYDTFDGQIRGPVSVYEAGATVLGVVRAEPTLIGDVWSMTRDEPRSYAKHVITRRQIVQGSSGVQYDLDLSNGDSDVIVEYYSNCDPNRRAEVRETIGSQSITPKRINGFGVSSHEQATLLARWYAAVAYYRRETKPFSVELIGRIFARNDPALIETWFLDTTQAVGVESRNGFNLTFDQDVTISGGERVVLRDEKGLEWGPVAITQQVDSRTVTLYSADVTAVQNYTGKTLASLFTKTSRRMPMTAWIGQLSEVSRPYIIRSVKHQPNYTAQIEAVYDAPEVWTILGETVEPGPPVLGSVDQSAQVPILPWVSTKIIQKATTLLLEWSVGVSANANRYQVWMKYADRTDWEYVYDGPATEGSYPVDFSTAIGDLSVQVRARCVSTAGVPSEFKFSTATLFAPTINSESANLEVEIANLSAQLRYQLSLIDGIGQGSLADLRKRLDDITQEIAAAAATESAANYEHTDLVKVALDGRISDAFAAIQQETTVRISEDEALADQVNALAVRMNDFDNSGSNWEAAIADERQARIDADGALAQETSDLRSRMDNAESGLSAEADARSQLTTRVSQDEDQLHSLAQKVDVLSTSQGGNTATLTTLQQSIDGVKVQFGVVGNINGSTGGFIFTGVRKLDGSVSYTVEISGDLFVDGSITGRKISGTSLIISGEAQVGGLVINNGALKNNAASQVAANAIDGNDVSVTLSTRATGTVSISVFIEGGAVYPSSAPAVWIYRDGNLLTARTLKKYHDTVGATEVVYTSDQTVIQLDSPGAGTHTYRAYLPNGGATNVYIIVTENSK